MGCVWSLRRGQSACTRPAPVTCSSTSCRPRLPPSRRPCSAWRSSGVGDLLLPRAAQVVAAANPPERAADGWDLTPPLANRFLHIAYAPAVDGWIDGMTAGFSLPAGGRVAEPNRERTAIARAQVGAFIRSRPALLDAYPTNPAASGRAWPSRRTWTMTADVLSLLEEDDTEAAFLAASGL